MVFVDVEDLKKNWEELCRTYPAYVSFRKCCDECDQSVRITYAFPQQSLEVTMDKPMQYLTPQIAAKYGPIMPVSFDDKDPIQTPTKKSSVKRQYIEFVKNEYFEGFQQVIKRMRPIPTATKWLMHIGDGTVCWSPESHPNAEGLLERLQSGG